MPSYRRFCAHVSCALLIALAAGFWLAAKVLLRKADCVLVHFIGWNSSHDELIPLSSGRLALRGMKAQQPARKGKRKAESALHPTGAQLVALQKVALDSAALSDTVQLMDTDEASATRTNETAPTGIEAAVEWFPKMFAGLRDCFVGGAYDEEMAGLLVTPGHTSCAFVGSTDDELLGVGIADTDRNHICYVAAWGMPGRAVSETIVNMLRPGNVTLNDGTNAYNGQFWPDLGFGIDADRTRNPGQSPKQMIASRGAVLAKIDEKWCRSKKRWVEGTDFRVLKFALTKTDMQSLHHSVFGCDMPGRRATTVRVAAACAAAEIYGDHLTKKWLLKSVSNLDSESTSSAKRLRTSATGSGNILPDVGRGRARARIAEQDPALATEIAELKLEYRWLRDAIAAAKGTSQPRPTTHQPHSQNSAVPSRTGDSMRNEKSAPGPSRVSPGRPATCDTVPHVISDFLRRPDVAKRNSEIANNKEKNGGWRIGQLLQKKKGTTLEMKTAYGVVVEVVCIDDDGNSDPFAFPWVLWEGDAAAMYPSDPQRYVDYKNAYNDSTQVTPSSRSILCIDITAEQLDSEWKEQQEGR